MTKITDNVKEKLKGAKDKLTSTTKEEISDTSFNSQSIEKEIIDTYYRSILNMC